MNSNYVSIFPIRLNFPLFTSLVNLQIFYIGSMHLIKIDPKVFHLALHVFVFDADLDDLGMEI